MGICELDQALHSLRAMLVEIGEELLDDVRAIKAGKGKRRVAELSQDVQELRERACVSLPSPRCLVSAPARCGIGSRAGASLPALRVHSCAWRTAAQSTAGLSSRAFLTWCPLFSALLRPICASYDGSPEVSDSPALLFPPSYSRV